MCLIAFAVQKHPDYPLILMANRDEFFGRPTTPLHEWEDLPIVGGRDEKAKGTWLAVNRRGRWAAVTNYRDPNRLDGPLSRGKIISDCLTTKDSLQQFVEQLDSDADAYSGFNFVAGEAFSGEAFYYSNIDKDPKRLGAGFYSVSNGLIDDRWPKMQWLEERLMESIGELEINTSEFFEHLKHTPDLSEYSLPNTGIGKELETRLAQPFIKPFDLFGKTYGTRSSALVIAEKEKKNIRFEEVSHATRDLSLFSHSAINLSIR